VVNRAATSAADPVGHGTHIAGLIAGRSADGAHVGVAPDARVVGVKIADDRGMATAADLLRGLEWVHANRVARAIRVVSLSVTVGTPESYLTSPVAAAVERLWFDGVVVVVAAGNDGAARDTVWYAPANDPYVITVGCLDQQETAATTDDGLCFFSSRGRTQDGFAKPDVVAPGRKLVSTLAPGSAFARDYPERLADATHIRMSGTSMAAPVVAGTVALLLERAPTLTPDQVKWLLMRTERPYAGQADGAGATDAAAATRALASPLGRANQGIRPSQGSLLALSTLGGGLVGSLTSLVWDQTYWETGRWATHWETGRWAASDWTTGRWATGRWAEAPHD
jgi:serine protease AprX